MPRKYIKKKLGIRDYQNYTPESLAAAISAVKNQEMSIRQASTTSQSADSSSSLLSDAVLECFQATRYGSKDNEKKRGRGKKMDVPAGRSVPHFVNDSEEDESGATDQPSTSAGKRKRNRKITAADLDRQLNEIYENLLINHEEAAEKSSSDDDGEDEY